MGRQPYRKRFKTRTFRIGFVEVVRRYDLVHLLAYSNGLRCAASTHSNARRETQSPCILIRKRMEFHHDGHISILALEGNR